MWNNTFHISAGASSTFPFSGEMNVKLVCCFSVMFHFSVVSRDDGCTTKLAMGNAVDMWANESIDVIIGPPCSAGKLSVCGTMSWERNVFLCFDGLL
jgi:hypothetical protein